MMLRIEIFKSQYAGRTQPWFVHVRAANGEILTVSEGYYSKWNAKRAAKRMFPNVPIVYTKQ